MKILVIDEQQEDRALLLREINAAILHPQCYEVSAETALEWFRAIRPDCVVMELRFRDAVGMEVLHALQNEMKGKHVPIFVWTCLRHEALAKLAVTAGVTGYFEKSNGTHKTLIDAIVRAAAEKRSPDDNLPSHG